MSTSANDFAVASTQLVGGVSPKLAMLGRETLRISPELTEGDENALFMASRLGRVSDTNWAARAPECPGKGRRKQRINDN